MRWSKTGLRPSLRKTLGPHSRAIATVTDVGYRFDFSEPHLMKSLRE